ncbi:MAG TPA: sigma 54-interacting transcriptional regulator [Kofleriaceae bacterium]
MSDGPRAGSMVVALKRTASAEVFELGDSMRRWVVGSNPSNDLAFEDPYLSNVHCVLERRPNGALIVRDANSRNGTFIDGNPIESGELRIGAFLTVGRTTLVAIAAAAGEPRHAIELLRGQDPSLRTTVEQAMTAARTDCSVLVLGETGTGKDLLARVIHETSRRAHGPFVAVNCGSIARELVASELFGHERGAFTGATDTRDGWFVEAHGGTLFLDEIGELPLELQPHLLRVLETRRVRRVGGTADRPIDVRIIAATHRTAGLGTEGSRLRPDLYHRLATVVLSLTPLRERMSDLGELVEGVLDDLSPEHGRKTVSVDGWRALASYNWPGNIRELYKAVQRAVTLGGTELGPGDFFPDLQHARRRHGAPTLEAPIPIHDGQSEHPLQQSLQPYHAALRGAMEQALATHGTIRAAASAIGMPKSTFADKAKAWGLSVRRKVRIHRPNYQPGMKNRK